MRPKKRKPTSAVLRELYVTQGMNQRDIGAQFGVPHITIRRWLIKFGIPLRDPLDHLGRRGITAPTKDELNQMVHVEHLPYRIIAERYSVDQSMVTIWLRKHSLPTPAVWDTRRKGNHPELPTEQELRDLYSNGMSQRAIGDLFGVSDTPIRSLFEKYGIDARTRNFNGGERWDCKDGRRVRSMYEAMVANWLYSKKLEYIYEPHLPFLKYFRSDFLVNGWYVEIWGIVGSATYDAQKAKKKYLYGVYNLPLINIDAWCFAKNSDTWAIRLSECLTPAHAQGMLF